MIGALQLDILPLLSPAHPGPDRIAGGPLVMAITLAISAKAASRCRAGRDRKDRTRSAELSVAPTLSGLRELHP